MSPPQPHPTRSLLRHGSRIAHRIGTVITIGAIVAGLCGCRLLPIQNSTDGKLEVYLRTGAGRVAEAIGDEKAKVYARVALPFARVSSRVYCKHLASKAGLNPEVVQKE